MSFTLVWARTCPPSASEAWTIHLIERESRYWVDAQLGRKTNKLFEPGTHKAWEWAKPAPFIRWFTGWRTALWQALWKLAAVRLKLGEFDFDYFRRKVWRQGLEVAMKIKGSLGRKPVEWVKLEHPFTALTGAASVHANHNLAQNSAFKRRTSAEPRRHLDAQRLEGLQRLLDVQRLVHPLGTTALETGKKEDFGNGNRIVCPSRFNQSILTSHGFDCLTHSKTSAKSATIIRKTYVILLAYAYLNQSKA